MLRWTSWSASVTGFSLCKVLQPASAVILDFLQVEGVDKVVPLLFVVWDEAQSPYFNDNIAASSDPAVSLVSGAIRCLDVTLRTLSLRNICRSHVVTSVQ